MKLSERVSTRFQKAYPNDETPMLTMREDEKMVRGIAELEKALARQSSCHYEHSTGICTVCGWIPHKTVRTLVEECGSLRDTIDITIDFIDQMRVQGYQNMLPAEYDTLVESVKQFRKEKGE